MPAEIETGPVHRRCCKTAGRCLRSVQTEVRGDPRDMDAVDSREIRWGGIACELGQSLTRVDSVVEIFGAQAPIRREGILHAEAGDEPPAVDIARGRARDVVSGDAEFRVRVSDTDGAIDEPVVDRG